MSTQVEIDTSILEQMDFESGCEVVTYYSYQPGMPEATRCSKVAYAVANIHSIKWGHVTKTMLICKECLDEWKTQDCYECPEPFVRDWMII